MQFGRLARTGGVALLCLTGDALAQTSFTYVTVDSTSGDTFPIGSAVRQWGPTDKVVIVVDSRTEDDTSDDDQHHLTFRGYTCSNGDDCATPTALLAVSPADELRFRQMFHPSVGIRYPSGGPTTFHVVGRAKIETDCDQDTTEYDELDVTEGSDPDALALDLKEWEATAGGSVVTVTGTFTVETNDNVVPCRDHKTSHTKTLSGDTYACWMEGAITATPVWWVECGLRYDWDTTWATYFTADTVYGDPLFEDPWFGFRDDEPVVALHDGIDLETEVHFPYEAGDPSVAFAALADDTLTPSIDITPAGKVRIAWADRDDASADTTQYSACASTEDCLDASDWTADHEDFPTDAQHTVASGADQVQNVQIVADGTRQFLIAMADPSGGSENWGVYFTTRCDDGEWETPILVKTRLAAGNDQRIDDGAPNIGINQDEDIVHIVFVESDDVADPASGTVFWAYAPYDPCT